MKKIVTVLVMLSLLLVGCGKKEKITFNAADHTISDGAYTYEYTDTVDGDVRTITIYYPDGGTYIWTQDGYLGSGNENYGPDRNSFTDGYTLVETIIVNENTDQTEFSGFRWTMIILGVVAAVLGFLQTRYPVEIWDMFLRRWYHEDPSEYFLTRFISGGICGIILGIVMILIGIFVY